MFFQPVFCLTFPVCRTSATALRVSIFFTYHILPETTTVLNLSLRASNELLEKSASPSAFASARPENIQRPALGLASGCSLWAGVKNDEPTGLLALSVAVPDACGGHQRRASKSVLPLQQPRCRVGDSASGPLIPTRPANIAEILTSLFGQCKQMRHHLWILSDEILGLAQVRFKII